VATLQIIDRRQDTLLAKVRHVVIGCIYGVGSP
jgi:hypothetical protein